MMMIRSNGTGRITVRLFPVDCRAHGGRKRCERDPSTRKRAAEGRRCLSDRTKHGVDAQIQVELAPGLLTRRQRQFQGHAKMNGQHLRDCITRKKVSLCIYMYNIKNRTCIKRDSGSINRGRILYQS